MTVLSALNSVWQLTLLCVRFASHFYSSQLDGVVELARQHGIPLKGSDMSKLNHLSAKRPHQGVILVASRLEFEQQDFLTREEQK